MDTLRRLCVGAAFLSSGGIFAYGVINLVQAMDENIALVALGIYLTLTVAYVAGLVLERVFQDR